MRAVGGSLEAGFLVAPPWPHTSSVALGGAPHLSELLLAPLRSPTVRYQGPPQPCNSDSLRERLVQKAGWFPEDSPEQLDESEVRQSPG